MREIDCAYVDEHDLVALYAAGKLRESDAEAFEAHFLGCDRCAAALSCAGEIRAALEQPILGPTPESMKRTPVSREVWGLLAAAAAVAMFFLGIRHLALRPETLPQSNVFRSERTDLLDLSVEPGSDGLVILEWAPQPGARSYRVEVFRSDGLPVLKSDTPHPRIELNVGAFPPAPTGISFLARIKALGVLNQVVAESGLKPLPSP